MGREIGYGFTNAQRHELWDRYQQGVLLRSEESVATRLE